MSERLSSKDLNIFPLKDGVMNKSIFVNSCKSPM